MEKHTTEEMGKVCNENLPDEKEIPKRLSPLSETLRELFLKSGNLCAFPGCSALNMSGDGTFTAQVCHIQAAEPGGERFNELMNNEERRHFSNLMIMCYAHHVTTNNVNVYTTKKMKELKSSHESRFSNPERVMLEQVRDWTTQASFTVPITLQKYAEMVGGLEPKHIKSSLAELRTYINAFRFVPVQRRKFLSALISRMNSIKTTNAVYQPYGYPKAILMTDLIDSLGLSEESIKMNMAKLQMYNLGYLDESETDHGLALQVHVSDISDGWTWSEIYDFCGYAKISLEVFTIEMDFHRLDVG